jgi:hypothetical protein
MQNDESAHLSMSCFYHVHFVYQNKPTVQTEFCVPQVFYFISNMFQSRWISIQNKQVPKFCKCDHVELV